MTNKAHIYANKEKHFHSAIFCKFHSTAQETFLKVMDLTSLSKQLGSRNATESSISDTTIPCLSRTFFRTERNFLRVFTRGNGLDQLQL